MTTEIRDILARYSRLVPRESLLRDIAVIAIKEICDIDIPPTAILVHQSSITVTQVPSPAILLIRSRTEALVQYINDNQYGFVIDRIG